MGAKESNPALENVSMTMGRPAAAYPDQDHIAHIKVHLGYAKDPAYGGNPVIGPSFAPLALQHIKQHLTLHYLQSMRSYVAEAAGGEDAFELHQEKPLDREAQQALAIASQMVSQDAQQIMQPYLQEIQGLAQKVQQAQQQQSESAALADPTANVIMKTQMAETQRKTQEFQSKMQADLQKTQQEYQLRVAELEKQVQDVMVKYQTQTDIDNQRNATDIAMANINNAAKERVAQINAGVQLTQQQAQMEHEQNQSAIEAMNVAENDIRQHGLKAEQTAFQQQADQVKQQAQAQHDAALAEQEHQQAMQQQAAQQQQAAMQQAQPEAGLQQPAAPLAPPTPPQGQ
jgi:hypothetical protein